MKRFDRMLSAMLAWSWMPGIARRRAERRAEHVAEAGRGEADEDDLVLEDRRIDQRLLAVEELTLGLEEVPELERRDTGDRAVDKRRRAVVDQHRQLIVRWPLDARCSRTGSGTSGMRRSRTRMASPSSDDVVRAEAAELQRRGDAERRQKTVAVP